MKSTTYTHAGRNSPEIGSDRRGDAVALRVEVVADVHRVARLALVVIVVHRRLEQERVLALRVAHFMYSLLGRLDEHGRFSSHDSPHLLVRRNLGHLQSTATFVDEQVVLSRISK